MQIIRNTGLVLEGGGMRGVFTSGVLDAFMKHELYFNYVVAVSAGACNGLSYMSRQPRRARISNIDMLAKYDYIGLRHLFTQGSIFDPELLYERFPNEIVPYDYDTYFSNPATFEMVTTNCLTGKAEYMDDRQDKSRLMKICRASCSMPLLTPIVNVDETPYLDGGLADSVPVRRAQETGNDKIVVILTKNEGYRKKVISPAMQRVYKRAYKSYPNLIRTIFRRSFEYNKTMNHLDQLEKRGEIFVLRPQVKPVSRLERNKESLLSFYEHGYQLAERKLDDMMKYLEC